VAVEIDLGVVCLVDVDGHGFASVLSLLSPQDVLPPTYCFHAWELC
jgi:hypothetical protein